MSDLALVILLLPVLAIMLLVGIDLVGFLFFDRPSLIAFTLHLIQLPDEQVEEITEQLRQAAKKDKPK